MLQGSGVHGSIVRRVREKATRHHDKSKGIPPGGVVGEDNQRAGSNGKAAGVCQANTVKVAADIPVQIPGEE